MSEDLASIGIAVDATPVDLAAKSMDNFTRSATTLNVAISQFNSLTAAGLSDQAAMAAMSETMQKTLQGNAEIMAQLAASQEAVTATAVAETVANDALNNSYIRSRPIYEAIVIAREALRGNFTRMAGSIALEGQFLGFITAATLPYILTIGGLIGATIAVDIATIQYNQSVEKLTASTVGLGAATGNTAQDLQETAAKSATAFGLTVGASQQAAIAFNNAGVSNTATIEQLTGVSQVYAELLGEKLPQANKDLATAMADPAKGAEELNSKLEFLDQTTLQHIETLSNLGDKEEAQNILLDALKTRTDLAREAGVGMQGNWSDLVSQASILWNWIGKVNQQLELFQSLGLGFLGFQSAAQAKAQAAQAQITGQTTLNTWGTNGASAFGATPEGQDAAKQQQLQTGLANATQGQLAGSLTNNVALYQQSTTAVQEYTRAIESWHGEAQKEIDISNAQQAATSAKTASAKAAAATALVQAQNEGVVKSALQVSTEAYNASALATDKVNAKHHAAAVQYTDLATQLDDYTVKLNKEASLYGIFDPLQSEAISKTNQEVDSIEKKRDAKNHLIDVNAQEISQLEVQTAAVLGNQDINKQGVKIWNDLNLSAKTYYNTLLALIVGTANKSFTPQQAQRERVAATNTYNEATDPFYKQNQNITNQISLLGQLGPELAANQVIQTEVNSAVAKAQPINQVELDIQKARLLTQQQANEIQSQEVTLYNATYTVQERNIQAETAALRLLSQHKETNGELTLSTQEYSVQLAKITQQELELEASSTGNWAIAMTAGLHSLVATGKTVGQQLTTTFGTFFDSIETGVADSFGKWITGTETLSQALKEVAQTALSGLISGLIKIGEQQLLQAAIGKSIELSSNATTLASQTALAPVLAANALNTSIISFGAAAVAGSAAYVTAEAVGAASNVFGLAKADGGYISGPGGPRDDKIKAFLSNGEFVVNAYATAKNRSALEAMNSGYTPSNDNHYANGGIVAANNNSAPTLYQDFTGANFGGSDPDQIMNRFAKVMQNYYGPMIVKQASQTAIKTQAKLGSRQKLNPFGSKAS